MLNNQPLIVDLGMSDTEYLELLSNGQDPIKELSNQCYETALICYGIAAEQAHQLAPLFEKLDCSIDEKISVNNALRHIWKQLIGQQ